MAAKRRASAKSGDVIGQRRDLPVGEFLRRGSHHAVRVVSALAAAKRLELRHGVVGVLAGEPWKLGWHTRPGRTVAARARRDTARRDAPSIYCLPQLDELGIARGTGL